MRRLLILLVLGLQAAWLLGTVVHQEMTLHTGRLIMLETRPVDPRDPLRGDYVRLNYQISDVPLKLFTPELTSPPASGTPVFVALTCVGTNQFWTASRASLDQFVPAADEVLLSGHSEPPIWGGQTGSAHVVYGIEQYFVAEGMGNPRGTLTAKVSVAKSGSASLKEVFVDGKPYSEAVQSESR